MEDIGYGFGAKTLLGAAGVGAAIASGSVAETFYIDAILGGKTVIPSLATVYALPYAVMVTIAALGICSGVFILTENAFLAARLAVAAVLSIVGVVVTSDIIGSDEYFMYDNDGARAIYANKLIAIVIAIVSLFGL